MKLPDGLARIAESFPHRLLFATVSGAHLYGFPSRDSDWDLRGCHVLPAADLLGLREPEETIERAVVEEGLELDLVSHDVRKLCRLLLRPNGYVLEQLLSPLVVVTSPEHAELAALAPQLVTRRHAQHYLGFAQNQWRPFEREPRVKTLLYVYRVLLTGIHLMRTGQIEASLPALLRAYPLDGVAELVVAKVEGTEKQELGARELERHRASHARLLARLEQERDRSRLPDATRAHAKLDAFAVRVRSRSGLP